MPAAPEPQSGSTVRVLDEDLELAAVVPQGSFREARLAAVAPLIELPAGPWEPPSTPRDGDFGLLVLRGLLLREMQLAGRSFVEFRGSEDLLRPWDDATEITSVRAEITWTAREPTRIAWLDGDFASSVTRWPELTSALMARATRRARLLSFRMAILELRHVDLRVLLLLWHLADRWGQVSGEGVRVNLDLTHDLIARSIGAHRTSVTIALRKLSDEGRIARVGRRWVLLGAPPQEISDATRAWSSSGHRGR